MKKYWHEQVVEGIGRDLFTVVRLEVFTAVTMKNGIFGILRRVALVRTDVSEEPGASFIRVTRNGELGTTLALTGNRRTQPASVASYS
jgi:hypothetical protein